MIEGVDIVGHERGQLLESSGDLEDDLSSSNYLVSSDEDEELQNEDEPS